MLSVGIAHPLLLRGGSEADCLWAIEALKGDYDVTLITTARVDWDALNKYYGTSIHADEVAVLRPAGTRVVGRYPGAAVTGALHQRFCRKVAGRFDILFSGYNPCDFGRRGIHRIGDVGWNSDLRERCEELPGELQRTIHRDGLLRRGYLALARGLSRPSGRNIFDGEDILLVNSDWTGRVLAERFPQARLAKAYPPVAGQFESVPWQDRGLGFVCLGRISHEKRIETMIEILSRVRQLGHDVHLHIIGPLDDSPYGRSIQHLCDANSDWIKAEGGKSGKAKIDLLTGHRYAIHGRQAEPFGIAVAEMAKAGCIPFVPRNGGAPEIVGDERLCYGNVDDAVRKIDQVLRHEKLQRELREKTLARSSSFGVEDYQRSVRQVVADMASDAMPRGGQDGG